MKPKKQEIVVVKKVCYRCKDKFPEGKPIHFFSEKEWEKQNETGMCISCRREQNKTYNGRKLSRRKVQGTTSYNSFRISFREQ